MKVEIFREEFKRALGICERITRRALGLPILQNILIKAEGGFLELTTTNLETTIKYWVLAKVKQGGETTASASFLANLVNLAQVEKIDLLEENNQLVLLSENQESQIPTQSSQDFPLIPKIDTTDAWQVGIEDLVAGLGQVVEIPAISQLRPEITGVFFSFKKNKLQIVGTDSFRLAEKTITLRGVGKKEGSFIVPQTTARELLNILGPEQGVMSVYFTPNQVLFEISREETAHPKIRIFSRLIEGDYPPYQEIIPKASSTQIRLEREVFMNQIKQAGLFSGKIAEVKLKTLIKDGKLRIFSQSTEAGRNESFINCQIIGADLEIAFNYRFLLGGLSSIKGSEVMIECGGPDKPGLIKPVGDANFLYVLMPLQAS
ncbi:MAG: DNA polymerase III subunit beta [Candidatus Pacebacteria bacterium]|nr:DNA polymerase III subunit beta [Candidatus Paceibacterota bacterium]